MTILTLFEFPPIGADSQTLDPSFTSGTGTIDLSDGETETISFNTLNGLDENGPSARPFTATETGPGEFTVANSQTGEFTFTITQAEWVAAGSPSSVALEFGSASAEPATYTLNITCFAPGTAIATRAGDRAIETLAPGDTIRTADGRDVPVRWVGRQTVSTVFAENTDSLRLIHVDAGALGAGLPRRDLRLTADHALVLDGMLVNAGALVGLPGVTRVPMAELGASYTVYHVETDAHDTLLAEGCPAETFIDYVGRNRFDNYPAYLAAGGRDDMIPEMDLPRVSSARMLPAHLRPAAAQNTAQNAAA